MPSLRRVEEKEEPEVILEFIVFKKRWLWGEKFFCICDEVLHYEGLYLMKTKGQIIAILPERSFSCAIHKTGEE